MLDIAILDGVRTPFVKAFGPLAEVPAQELGRVVTVEALRRLDIKPDRVDQVVFGNVAMPPDAANVARVIALQAGIPEDRIAHTVQRNCASGMEAITTAAQLLSLEQARLVVAGGTESMSQIPLLYDPRTTGLYQRLAREKSLLGRLGTYLRLRLAPGRPVIAIQQGLTDPVSGLIMGSTAEVLVRDFGLSRQEQDTYALLSHQRAVAAQDNGTLAKEIVPVTTAAGETIKADVGPRREQTLEALAKLPPVFEKGGTVTVGNSCMLTDGAAAVVLMRGQDARAEGRRPLGYLRAFAYAGLDPRRMGLGPAHATAKLLERTGWGLNDFDLVELNEAFAAVVLANERAFASADYARDRLGRSTPLGTLDRGRLNVNGGAVALGHPVGATGTRLVLTLLKEMQRRGLRRGLATLCVGGGQGAALALEAAITAAERS